MSRIERIAYKDRQILSIDHSNLEEAELLENMRAATKLMLEHKGDKLLCLISFEGTYTTEKVFDELKSKEALESMKNVEKTAVLGVTGIKKIFLNAYNQMTGKQIRAFNTKNEALEYLVAE